MAFNFNWAPLIADTSRARSMLTTALNKSPKPPIIVDDILVTELNLGSVPPELEILEIGDLAEDRFRGIFKMSYTGDAFLTLKTKVEANPLNTYLSAKPTFASPQPLAAGSSLTIPLQITLSDIRLSGFIILVFSRQKGITVVFRNDPLESLKVSSTFDSIPFVRDYLQREIESQLRFLFMEDLPAIIHRLSLRIWASEEEAEAQLATSERLAAVDQKRSEENRIDPFASPALNPLEPGTIGRLTEDAELGNLSLDSPSENHAHNFSQRNLLRLAALTDSHRTLSIFTPPIQDAVFRAWAGAAERGEMAVIHSPPAGGTVSTNLAGASFLRTIPRLPSTRSLPSMHSSRSSSIYSFSDKASRHSRGTLSTTRSDGYTVQSFGGVRSRPHRRRKNRVVDLRHRHEPAVDGVPEENECEGSRPSTPTSNSSSRQETGTWAGSDEREGELVTPPVSPEKIKDKTPQPNAALLHSPRPLPPSSGKKLQQMLDSNTADLPSPSSLPLLVETEDLEKTIRPRHRHHRHPRRPALSYFDPQAPQTTLPVPVSSGSTSPTLFSNYPFTYPINSYPGSGGILEQAWMMKMATDIAKRMQEEREREQNGNRYWSEGAEAGSSSSGGNKEKKNQTTSRVEMEAPPPAYAA